MFQHLPHLHSFSAGCLSTSFHRLSQLVGGTESTVVRGVGYQGSPHSCTVYRSLRCVTDRSVSQSVRGASQRRESGDATRDAEEKGGVERSGASGGAGHAKALREGEPSDKNIWVKTSLDEITTLETHQNTCPKTCKEIQRLQECSSFPIVSHLHMEVPGDLAHNHCR